MIVAVGVVVGVVIASRLRPIDGHLSGRPQQSAVRHLARTVSQPRYVWSFSATILLATGGFMLMPFGSAFSVNNLGIALEKLPVVYMATGVAAIVAGPLMGRLSDTLGKYRVFCIGSAMAMGMVVYYCRLGPTPLAHVIVLNIILFVAITGRMVSAQALASAIPAPSDRGAFMSVSSSLQQISGGIASFAAGLIVTQTKEGPLAHYERLGYVVAGAIAITVVLMFKIDRMVNAPRVASGASSSSPAERPS
jgi:predicted MFS family arabinose efflux permease